MEYYSAVKEKRKEERNFDTDNNPGKSPENYVEWKKNNPQSCILYGSIYVTFLK